MSELSETNSNLPVDTELKSNVQEGADLNNNNSETSANDKASKVRYLPELDPSVDTSNLSKRQIKKLRKTLQYEQTKAEKKKELKAKDKAKRAAKKELFDKGLIPVFEKPKPIEQIPSGVNVILDMNFESLMLEKEIKSVVGQVGRCYAANKRVTTPVHIKMTGVESKVDVLMSKLLRDYKNWKMFDYNSENFVDLIEEKDKLVYLTADSDNIIENLEVGNYYIIGGIVDKNRHKNLTLNKAKELGIKTGQLPISEYVKLSQRKVLAVNHVFEILVEYLQCKDWKQAFEKVIPQRKLDMGVDDQSAKGEDEDEGDSNNAKTEEEEGDDDTKVKDEELDKSE